MSSSLLKLNNFFLVCFENNTYNEMIILVNKITKKSLQIVLSSVGTVIQKINHDIHNEFKIRLYIYTHTLVKIMLK